MLVGTPQTSVCAQRNLLHSDNYMPHALSSGSTDEEFCSIRVFVENCIARAKVRKMMLDCTVAMAAQSGYPCDYYCKRLARGFQEVRHHTKGHHAMQEAIKARPCSYIFKRHAARILSDAYGKDIVRSLQVWVSLNVMSNDIDVTAAETITTAMQEPFPWTELLGLMEHKDHSSKGDNKLSG